MNVGDVITIGQDALWTAVLIASPLLGTALVLGVVIVNLMNDIDVK